MNTIKIEMGGALRGIKFTMLSLEKFEEIIPLTQRPERTKLIYATFYAGLVGYSFAKNEEQDYTFEDVQEWVDKLFHDNKTDEIKMVCDLWGETEAFKDRIKTIENWTNKVRGLVEDETTEKETGPSKKKAISRRSGSKLKNLHLVH